jgi:hypothetical protein
MRVCQFRHGGVYYAPIFQILPHSARGLMREWIVGGVSDPMASEQHVCPPLHHPLA